MAAGTQMGTDAGVESVPDRRVPEISTCESSPGKAVFLECGNTDGWIASDTTVEVTR